MNCTYWQECGIIGGGCCHHPESPWKTPSLGICTKVCKLRVEGEPMPPMPPRPKAEPKRRRLGDFVEALVKPLGQAIGLPCYQPDGTLKPESGCAKRRDALNRLGEEGGLMD